MGNRKRIDRYDPNTFNAMNAAVTYLLFYAVIALSGLVLSVGALIVVRTGGVLDEGVLLFVNEWLLFFGLGGLALLIAKKKRIKLFSGGGFRFDPRPSLEGLMTAVGTCGLLILLSPLAEKVSEWVNVLYETTGAGATSSEIATQYEGLLVFTVLVMTPIIPAIVEELIFRGIILRGLMQYGKTAAIVLSAFLFALAHRNAEQFVYQFFLALAIGALVTETRNLFLGMLAHFTNNLFASLSAASLYSLTGEGALAPRREAVAQLLFVLLAVICFTIALVYFVRRFKTAKKEANSCLNAAMVGGNGVEMKPWRECGGLAEENGQVFYLNEKEEICSLNARTKTATPIVLISIGALLCFAELVLNFLLPYIEYLLK